MWVELLTVVAGLCGMVYWKRARLRRMYLVTHVAFRFALQTLVLKLSSSYPVCTGGKDVSQTQDLARITYQNSKGKMCCLYVPFAKSAARRRRAYQVFLVQENERGGYSFSNVTQEPGLEYLLSPEEMGGIGLYIYRRPWDAEGFPEEHQLVSIVRPDQRLPRGWKKPPFELDPNEPDEHPEPDATRVEEPEAEETIATTEEQEVRYASEFPDPLLDLDEI